MRRAVAPLLLALLLVAPALAQNAPVRPNLDIVDDPTPSYSVGDYWVYNIQTLGNNNTFTMQNQTLRVEALEDFEGTPAVRLFGQSVEDLGDPNSTAGAEHSTSNKTTWVTRNGQDILRIEEIDDRTQSTPAFWVWTRTSTNWTFHQPMDVYAFPIVKDDAWVVLTNATLERNTTIHTHAVGNPEHEVRQPYQAANVTASSSTTWVRQDVCDQRCAPAGPFDVVVLASRSGNATVFDFWAPAAGNIVRREILNETGALAEVSALTAYKFANAPDLTPRTGPLQAQSNNLLLLGAAAAAGILAALAALAVWTRAKQRGAPPPEPPMAPQAPQEPEAGEPQEPGPPT
jgi:hypothetical protein